VATASMFGYCAAERISLFTFAFPSEFVKFSERRFNWERDVRLSMVTVRAGIVFSTAERAWSRTEG